MPKLAAESGRGTRFAVSAIWSGLAVVAGLATGLLLSPYLIRKLGPDGYGVWALSFALIEYYWLLDLGFRSATVKFVAHYWTVEDSARVGEVVSTALVYSSGVALILIPAIVVVAPTVQQKFQIAAAYQSTFVPLLVIVTVSWCLSIVFGVFGAALEAAQRFDLSNQPAIVGTLVRTAGTFVLLHLGYSLIEIGILSAVSQTVVFALQYRNFRVVFRGQRIGPRCATVPMLKQMMGFGVHTFVGNVSQQFLTQGAPLLIGHFHPAMFVGFYVLPVRLLQYTVEMVGRIGLVTNSNAAELSARNDQHGIGKLAIYSNRYCLAVFMPIAILLGTQGRALFEHWVGPEFTKYSAPILPVLLVGSVIAIVGQFSSTMLLQGLAKHQSYARGLLLEAILGMAALWLIIPVYGILGAAWVSSIFMIANRCLFISWLTSRAVGMSFAGFLRGVYAAPLISAVPVFAFAWFLHSALPDRVTLPQLAGIGLGIAISYYGMAFFFVLADPHRAILMGWAGRILPLRRNPT